MAEALSDGSDDENERLLECPVCMNQLRDQRMLPCQHTFCTSCIEPLVQTDRILCPVCREVCELKGKKVPELPRNLFLGSVQDKQCEDCLSQKKKVTCLHCRKKVCHSCLMKHKSKVKEQLKQLKAKSEQCIPAIANKIRSIHDDISEYNKQADLQAQLIDETANKMIKAIMERQKALKEKLTEVRNSAVEALHLDVRKLSLHISNVYDYEQKINNLDINVNTLGEAQDISTQWSEEVESAKMLTETTTHSAVNFLVDQEKLLDIASTFGEIRTKSQISKVDGKPRQMIYYKSKGVPQCVFGTKGTQQGQLNGPSFIAVSPVTSNIVVCDRGNDRIQIFKANWEFVSQFGSHGKGDGQFDMCENIRNGGVAVTNNGVVVVADTGNHRLQLITKDGRHIRTIGKFGSRLGHFNWPRGVATDKSGLIYVCDAGNDRIQILQQDGKVTLMFDIAVGKGFSTPSGVAVASTGDIIVTTSSSMIYLYTQKGQHKRTLNPNNLGIINMQYSCGVAIDPDDNIIVSDYIANQIYIFKMNGKLIHNFGGKGSNPGQFKRPVGVACTQEGHIVVADSDNNRIQIY